MQGDSNPKPNDDNEKSNFLINKTIDYTPHYINKNYIINW